MTAYRAAVHDERVISVVVACFDAEQVLPDQLAALARQRDPGPWQLVLADNGSRDGTRGVADAFAREHPELDVLVLDASARRGAGPARNAGVAAARGEVVAFCDADDVVADDWVAQVRAGTAQHAFVAGRFDEGRLNPAWLSQARGASPDFGLQRAVGAPGLCFSGAGNLALARELFEAVGGFDPRCLVLEDNDLCWRVQLSTGEPLVWWPGALVHVRLRSTLPGMFRQGAGYGTSSTWLQARYDALGDRSASVPGAAPAETGGPGGATGAGDGPATASRGRPWWLPERPLSRAAAGSVLWQLGWRAGRVRGRLLLRRPGRSPEPLRLDALRAGA